MDDRKYDMGAKDTRGANESKAVKDVGIIVDKGSLDRVSSDDAGKSKTVLKISAVTFAGNIILFILKTAAGVRAQSSALISDAVHTASDVFTTVLAFIGIRISEKSADREHQYGHERIEPVFSTVLATILIIVAAGMGKSGIESIIGYFRSGSVELSLGVEAFAVTIVSIVFKEVMFWYTRSGAKKIGSSALLADAWHHRSDALSSVAVLIGIAGAKWFNLPVLDPIMSVLVCVIIVKVGVQIYIGAVNQLIDKAASEEEVQKIVYFVSAVDGVRRIDLIRTRIHADKLYADVEISVDENLSVKEAHEIAELVHGNVEAAFPDIKHCMVHVNPYHEEG